MRHEFNLGVMQSVLALAALAAPWSSARANKRRRNGVFVVKGGTTKNARANTGGVLDGSDCDVKLLKIALLEWRNWQTRETQNLVVLSTVGVQFPPPAPTFFLT